MTGKRDECWIAALALLLALGCHKEAGVDQDVWFREHPPNRPGMWERALDSSRLPVVAEHPVAAEQDYWPGMYGGAWPPTDVMLKHIYKKLCKIERRLDALDNSRLGDNIRRK